MIVIEELNDFIERNDAGEPVFTGGRYLFRNGAISSSDGRHHQEPPPDRWERLELQKEFLEFRLKREVEAFSKFQQDCITQADMAETYGSVPPPPADAPQRLKRGKRRISILQFKLKRIQAELEQSPENREKKRLQELEGQRRNNISSLKTEIINASLD